MTAFWTGLWGWATTHWILAFVLFYFALKTVRVMFKSVFRIWWAPTVREVVSAPERADPNDDDDDDDDAVVRVEIERPIPPLPPIPPMAPMTRSPRVRQRTDIEVARAAYFAGRRSAEPPAKPRRSVWDRILGDDSD
jgi:hypothetical protein